MLQWREQYAAFSKTSAGKSFFLDGLFLLCIILVPLQQLGPSTGLTDCEMMLVLA